MTREVQEEDGRYGYPDVVQYEFIEGPYKGCRLNCPPSVKVEKWIDPDAPSKRHFSFGQEQPATYAYKMVVIDRTLYETPEFQVLLRSPLHLGGEPCIDNRAAPGK